MNLGLEDKVVIVTGGGSGIGEATVRAFAAEGAFPVVVDRDGEAAERVAASILAGGGRSVAFRAELTEEAEVVEMVKAAYAVAGRIDGVVNNAGVNDLVDIGRAPAEFVASLEKNLVHVYSVVHHAVDELRKARGFVVNIASKVAVTGQGRTSGYAAAKGGMLGLTREWAAALACDGVRVNAVVPAEVMTPLYERWIAAQPDPGLALAEVSALVPLGRRLTEASEIADTVVFLASGRSSHTTGQIVFVDGGYTHLDRRLGI